MSYNGHKNYNAWNVSLWINNDEVLYRWARQAVRAEKTRKEAAQSFVELMQGYGTPKTPDCVEYTVTNVMLAMQGM